MIFQKKHVEQILEGTKTQTRRLNRGYYRIGQTYSIQPCRTCKGIVGYRIEIREILPEGREVRGISISPEDAKAEGGYSPEEFEELFLKLNPTRGGEMRYVFKFVLVTCDAGEIE